MYDVQDKGGASEAAEKGEDTGTVTFYLNGEQITLQSPDPDLMLVDFLRQPDVGLTGPKKPCGQGGCGSCTVVLSHWDADAGKPVHDAINSCLRPVCALNGLVVTTIEGTGAVDRVMNPVAHRLAVNNGTQCGYCTNGWVMAMTGYLSNLATKPTKKEIEDLFDGNLCRCTGYRAILTGMKTFARDWTKEDEARRMKCEVDPGFDPKAVADEIRIPFPEAARVPLPPADVAHGDKTWLTADSVDTLTALFQNGLDPSTTRLIHGNTSFGVYKQDVEAATTYVDIRGIAELYGHETVDATLTIGAGTSYSDLIHILAETEYAETSALAALSYMARRTAGTLVRNAASLGGNTMLVLKHIHAGEPFPSDLATALCGVGASALAVNLQSGERQQLPLAQLIDACIADPTAADHILLVRFQIPTEGIDDIHFAQKVALREVNSHSIVNATTCLTFSETEGKQPVFGGCTLTFGGLAPYPWHAAQTAAFLEGKPATPDVIAEALAVLKGEVDEILALWQDRLSGLPDEGFTDHYRNELAQSYLYKAVINALTVIEPDKVPAPLQSAGKNYWGTWPVSDGTQTYQTDLYPAPLSKPYIKLMAMYQAQGEVKYTHEAPVPTGTLNGAFVQSARALARYHFTHPDTDRKATAAELTVWLKAHMDGFVDLITAADIPPGGKNMQGSGGDQPLFATEDLSYEGQSIALVLAETDLQAQAIAGFVSENCIAYTPSKSNRPPVLTIEEAVEQGEIFPDCPASAPFLAHIWKVRRPDSRFDWARDRKPVDRTIDVRDAPVGGATCQVIEGSQQSGAQLHFYMETQSTVALPQDDGSIRLHPSTQSPMTVQSTVCSALDKPQNEIGLQMRQLGGGYGGKTDQSRFIPAVAALAAGKHRQPVRLALARESDSAMIGRRHPYFGQYQLAVDTGQENPANRGLIRGFKADFWGDGGAFYDCSFVVSDCIQLRVDSAYYTPNYETTIDVCRTNKAPNTAYRAFGDIQGTLVLENAVEDAAVALDMEPDDFRQKNLYQLGQSTPGGQMLNYCYLREVWDFAKEKADYDTRRAEVAAFNAENAWRKRGLCLMPLKYGSGYNLVMLEQASAMVNVFSGDGTILIRQGGVDMGQGMITKVAQIAAYELNVPLEIIRIENSDTNVIPNPTSTGASTGTQYNGEAVRQACAALRARLQNFCYEMLKRNGEDWCKQHRINFWDYGVEGWMTPVGDGNKPTPMWQEVVSLAYENRVNLQAQVNAQMPGGIGPVNNIAFKPKDLQPTGTGIPIDPNGAFSETVNEYVGFTYNAACAEVEVDILTGETKILRADIIYDMGKSLNPAIDIGQIEGGFVQGVGYLLTEDLVFQPDGPDAGRLNTPNTWRYKPPATPTIPLEMNVHMFPRERAKRAPEDPNTLFSSKEVGEPPLVLANAVFFALKAAVRASRVDRGLSPLFRMDAPATVQEVRRACAVTTDQLDF